MTEVESINGVRNELNTARSRGELIGLVPTMGALHGGHIRLIRKMIEQVPFVVVSVFVNPTQFGPGEDFATYPRSREQDLEICRTEGVNLVFSPHATEMYPIEHSLHFEISGLADHLCGRSRPGHFNGVLQIVNKLFNITQPDAAIFGQKDIQQYVLISRMIQEFNHPVRLLMGETVREADGLAMSSRNAYLNKQERKRAPQLFRSLSAICRNLTDHPVMTVKETVDEQFRRLQASDLKIDYLSIVNYNDLQPVSEIHPGRQYIVAGAVFSGKTRLIDNIITDFT